MTEPSIYSDLTFVVVSEVHPRPRTAMPEMKWRAADQGDFAGQAEAQDKVRRLVVAAMAWSKAYVQDEQRRLKHSLWSRDRYEKLMPPGVERDLLKACREMNE